MDLESCKRWVVGLGSAAGALIAIITLWSMLGWPVPASRDWVNEAVGPLRGDSTQQLRIERRVVFNELFLWESNPTRDANINFNIQRLKAEIVELDRQIATRR